MRTLGDVFERLGELAPTHEPVHCNATLAGLEVEYDALQLILRQLRARELRAIGGTCRALRALAAQAQPPGLRLELFPHQRASLAWMLAQEAQPPHRGGILADEPGLGKTITCGALFCATSGLWTQPEPCAKAASAARDEAAWAALTIEYRSQAVCRALARLRGALPAEFALFASGAAREAAALPGYRLAVGAEPTDYGSVAKAEAVRTYGALANFECALRDVARNAVAYWSSAHAAQLEGAAHILEAARRLDAGAGAALDGLRAPAAAPALLRSRCTLVVVPRPLLRHWREQLGWHMGGLDGEILFDSLGDDGADAAAERLAAAAATSRALAAAALRALPAGGAERWRRASVFVTTAERLSAEERRRERGSELLRVRWLRLVVDEGHLIGAGALTAAKTFLLRLPAERRWVLSGTPARESGCTDGARSLDCLLAFLRHPLRQVFQNGLARPFARGLPGAAEALAGALRGCMVRHLKRTTRLPAPERRVVVLRCSEDERLAYNTIVAYVRANLVLTAMEGLETGAGWEASLLHPANSLSARRALDNVRETCNGGGEQVALLSAELFEETLLLLRERFRAPEAVLRRAEAFMHAARRGDASRCDACAVVARLHLLFPACGHTVCAECVTSRTVCCPACDAPLAELAYDKCARCEAPRCAHACARVPHVENGVDAFAYLQPGFELQWLETRRERAAEQLAAAGRAHALRGARARERRGGAGGSADGPGAEASPALAVEPAGGAPPDPAGAADDGAPAQLSLSHSKAAYVICRIEELRAQAQAAEAAAQAAREKASSAAGAFGAPAPFATPPRPLSAAHGAAGAPRRAGPRCVVYSESRRALNVLGHFLVLRFGEEAVAQFWGRYRGTELDKFRHRRVRSWRCTACPPRCARTLAPEPPDEAERLEREGGWRDVEWPDERCTGRHLHVRLELLHATLLAGAAPASAPAAAAGAGAAPAPPSVPRPCVVVNEEEAREFAVGVRWDLGQSVHVPLGALPRELQLPALAAGEAAGGWVRGRLERFTRCGAPMPAGCALSERPVDCFVLLLARDGSHGLDLSMVSHLFLIDKIYDAHIEAQVVARAFRMGATAAVTVEQLLMAGTVEEVMHADAMRAAATAGAGGSALQLAPPLSELGGAQQSAPHEMRTPARAAPPSAAGAAGKRPQNLGPDDAVPPGKRRALAAQPPPTVTAGGRRQEEGRVSFLLQSLAFLRDGGDDCSHSAAAAVRVL